MKLLNRILVLFQILVKTQEYHVSRLNRKKIFLELNKTFKIIEVQLKNSYLIFLDGLLNKKDHSLLKQKNFIRNIFPGVQYLVYMYLA